MKNLKLNLFTLIVILGVLLAGCNTGTNDKAESPENENQKNASDTKTENKEPESRNVQYYFTADEGGSITKIDASSDEVVDKIDADGVVHNVQVSPDNKILGATVVPEMNHGGEVMEMNGSVFFYDVDSNELLKTVEVGNHPAHIVFTEDGKYALVSNNEDDNVSVIDMEGFTVIQTIDTGNGPHGFRISVDSRKAYVANMGEDTVSILDLKTMKEEKRITVGPAPVTTGITSDGKTLVATSNKDNMVAIVDLETDQVEKVDVGKGPAQLYIDANNQFAYIANQGTEDSPSNSVSVVDLASKEVTATIETGKGSHGVVTSPDNKRLYVTNMYDNTVSVIDTENNKVIETVNVGTTPNGISITDKIKKPE